MKQKAFTSEHADFLRTNFPTTFGKMGQFGVGDGWFGLLKQLGETCEASKEGVEFLGMKEKYSSLVCYSEALFWVTEGNDASEGEDQLKLPLDPYRISTKALRDAIDKSCETCECCGNPGRRITSQYHWESISCRACREPTDVVEDYEGEAIDTLARYQACVTRICALFNEPAPGDDYEALVKLEAILDQNRLAPKGEG